MDTSGPETKAYLFQLYSMAEGDPLAQVSMYEVGEARGKEALEKILKELKTFMGEAGKSYGQLEEMVMDIKTIEIQMLSPHPKTGIIREVLKSIAQTLSEKEEMRAKLTALVAS